MTTEETVTRTAGAKGRLSRRRLLQAGGLTAASTGALALGLTGSSEVPVAEAAPAGGGFSFFIEIPDLPDASRSITAVHIDELNIDVRETTTGLDVEYRLYGPGAAHWGSASFTCNVPRGVNLGLQQWFNDAAAGKNIRKNISVQLFRAGRSRTYTLHDCFPTQWAPVIFDDPPSPLSERLTCSVGRIEFKV